MIQSAKERPKHFYNYGRIDKEHPCHSSRIFTHNELYFCTAGDFNDPFDCRFKLELRGTQTQKMKYYRELIKKREPELNGEQLRGEAKKRIKLFNAPEKLQQAQNDVDERIQEYGIYCLSEVRDSLLMWAHYADAHRGFCLEFSNSPGRFFVEMKSAPNGVKVRPFEVCYAQKFPTVNLVALNAEDTLKRTIGTKSSEWSYEKEWRMLDVRGKGPRQFQPQLLTGVIFGCKMTDEDKSEINRWCSGRQQKVEFYEARQKGHSYSLDIVKV